MANSKKHWLWLTKTYEERLRSYWRDSRKDDRESELQKKFDEEKSTRKRAEDRIERYQRAHGRFLNYMVKEFVLPQPPPQPDLGKKKAPICVPDEEAAAAPEKKKARVL